MLDEQLAKQVIIGCCKDVMLAERRFYHKRQRPRKPSLKQLEMSLISSPSLSSSQPIKGFRAFPYVRTRLGEVGLDDEVRIDHPDVNRAIRKHESIGFLQKRTDMPATPETDGYSGVNTIYTESDFVTSIKKLVHKLSPRAEIYHTLAMSGILERYLRVRNYVTLIRCRHLGFKDEIKVLKSRSTEPVLTKDIDEYEKIYLTDQKVLRKKSITEIFEFACQFSRKEMIQKHKSWYSDPVYTGFFIQGGIAYNEVHVIYPELDELGQS